MTYLVSLIKKYPLITFFVLACALSWWPWILYDLDLLPTPIVGFGPFLAALIVLAVTRGKTGVVGLLGRMVRWRVRRAPLVRRGAPASRWGHPYRCSD